MKIISNVIFLLLILGSCQQKTINQLSLIPHPQKLEQKAGTFKISSKTQITVSDNELLPLANLLKEYIKRLNGLELNISSGISETGNINLNLAEGLTQEEYKLEVSKGIQLTASNYNSLALGLSTHELNDLVEYAKQRGIAIIPEIGWMYEESIRMPLIVHYPKIIKAGSKNNWLINNTEYAPILLDLAGIEKPAFMQGESFVDALKSKKEPKHWRKATYYRYCMHMAHTHNNPAHLGIRTKKHNLIFYYGVDYTDTHNNQKVEVKDGNRFWESTPAA
jgi:hypothetical protein